MENDNPVSSTVQAIYRVYESTADTATTPASGSVSDRASMRTVYLVSVPDGARLRNTGFDGRMLRTVRNRKHRGVRLIDDLKRAGITVSGTQDHFRP